MRVLMEKISFSHAQRMYLILRLSEGMRDECAGKEETKADYQIHSRIFANAFASMIRYGFIPGCEDRDGMAFLTLTLNGNAYSCPARTIKNIMKTDFSSIEEMLPEAARLIKEEEARLAAESKNNRKKKKDDDSAQRLQQAQKQEPAPAPSVKPAPKPAPAARPINLADIELAVMPSATKPAVSAEPKTVPKQDKVSAALAKQVKTADTEIRPAPIPVPVPARQPVSEPVGQPEPVSIPEPAPEQGPAPPEDIPNVEPVSIPVEPEPVPAPQPIPRPEPQQMPAPERKTETRPVPESIPAPVPEPVGTTPEPAPVYDNGETSQEDIWTPKPQANVWTPKPQAGAVGGHAPETGQAPAEPEPPLRDKPAGTTQTTGHAFQKKQAQAPADNNFQAVKEPAVDDSPVQPVQENTAAAPQSQPAKGPRGMFSKFLPKSKKQEVAEAVPTQQPVQADPGDMDIPAVPDDIPVVAEEEKGERICHTHLIMLRKTYGTQVTGPYVIQVWPTEVIEMCPDRTPSAVFVRAQAPNGAIVCKASEGRTKYIVLDIDNKQFNVFGYWEGDKFISEVSAINKTASIYTASDEVEEECPEHATDAFLDQFRSREPHRPEFFVVPLSNSIPVSGTVPIAAFIRVREKNYPVTSRGPGDTLRFTYENQLSEISGWWENGKFTFSVKAVETV